MDDDADNFVDFGITEDRTHQTPTWLILLAVITFIALVAFILISLLILNKNNDGTAANGTGKDGVDGVDGIDGVDGVDGNSSLTYHEVTSGTYTILSTDDVIGVTYTATGEVTLTLPSIASLSTDSTLVEKRYKIVDEGGNASVNNIIIVPSLTDLIVGTSSFTINSDYGSVNLYCILRAGADEWFVA